MRRIVLIGCLLFAALGAASADAVKLRNGELLVGTITTQTRNDISIQVNGRILVIPKSDIQRVIYGNAEAEVRKYEELKLQLLREQEIRRAEEARLLEEKKRRESYGRLGLTLRSAALPGWGQAASGRTALGIGTGAVVGLSALYSWQLRNKALAARVDYDQSSTTSKLFVLSGASVALPVLLDSSSKQTYTRAVGRYNQSVNLLGFLYAAQIVHTFFLAGSPVRAQAVLPSPSPFPRSGQIVSFSFLLPL